MSRHSRISALFIAPHIDEVALFQHAAKIAAPESKSALRDIHSTDGILLATAALYKHLLHKHAAFISGLEHVRVTDSLNEALRPTKLLIIPGMFYKEHGEIGADGHLIMNIAKQLGFSAELVVLKSKGSVRDNVAMLKTAISSNTHPRTWLVSFSKGSLETRRCLEDLATEQGIPSNIKGWINISGMMMGSPLADMKLRSMISRFTWYLGTLLLGINYLFTHEVSVRGGDHNNFSPLPKDIELIHIVGIPLPSHVTTPLRKKYALLEKHGPNDGIVLLEDLLTIPGHIYPVWGADHLLRTSNMSIIIYKLCNYINNH